VQVFAEAAEDVELLDPAAQLLTQSTSYLLPVEPDRLVRYRLRFFFNDPIRYLQILSYTILHRYSDRKDLAQDLRVFQDAVYLAGTIIGDPARGMFEFPAPLAALKDRSDLEWVSVDRVGADLRVVARVRPAAS
jgi:hypothetical protein